MIALAGIASRAARPHTVRLRRGSAPRPAMTPPIRSRARICRARRPSVPRPAGRAADPRRLRLPRRRARQRDRARDESRTGTRCGATCPHTTIDASELHVGLPRGQMGNSEVGHLNIGAGRVVYQDFTRIDHAIANGEFAPIRCWPTRSPRPKANRTTLHVLGLLSPGRRPQPRAADRGDGRHGGERRRAARPRPRLSRRPRHAAEERGRVARLHATAVCAPAPRRAHRVDRRPLLRDGPRPALGPRARRPTT